MRPKRTACSKSWWKQIKRLTGKRKNDVTLVDPATECELNNKESVTMINDFFADLTKDYPRIKKEWFEVEWSDSLPKVSVEDVQNHLMTININKAPGPNDPVLKILKEFACVLAVPLTEIFNDSFREMYFPKIWRHYKIKSIPKSIPSSTADNLRPIALTSVLSKVQESFAVNWMNQDIHGKITESQFGGIRNSSTALALLYLTHKWYEVMDTPNRIIRIVFLDFKKAFDLIDHNVLLENMKSIGIRMSLIKWFAINISKREISLHGIGE